MYEIPTLYQYIVIIIFFKCRLCGINANNMEQIHLSIVTSIVAYVIRNVFSCLRSTDSDMSTVVKVQLMTCQHYVGERLSSGHDTHDVQKSLHRYAYRVVQKAVSLCSDGWHTL